jgi:hypothetical protein
VKESEIRLLFLRISNRYTGFSYDDYKVGDWLELLKDVPVERANANLRKYSLDPHNTFPPHPGILAATTVQQTNGPYIPNAEETRQMFAERDLEYGLMLQAPIPQSVRERMIELGFKPKPSTSSAE